MDGVRDTLMGANTGAHRVVMGRTEPKRPLVQDFGGGGGGGDKKSNKKKGGGGGGGGHFV